MIYYCLNCTKAVESKSAHEKNGGLICPECGQPIYYFGKETSHLSPQSEFDAYDDRAYTQGTEAFRGISRIYPNIKPSLEQLECEELLRYNSNNIKARYQLGKIYQSQFDFSQAKEHYNVILDTDANHVETRLRMSEICLAERRFEDAIRHLDKVLQHIPEDPTLHFNFAVAHHFSGRTGQAIRHLNIAEQLSEDPEFKAVVQNVKEQLSV
jgi:tetratricopeptide (TPR) repeat protein